MLSLCTLLNNYVYLHFQDVRGRTSKYDYESNLQQIRKLQGFQQFERTLTK